MQFFFYLKAQWDRGSLKDVIGTGLNDSRYESYWKGHIYFDADNFIAMRVCIMEFANFNVWDV